MGELRSRGAHTNARVVAQGHHPRIMVTGSRLPWSGTALDTHHVDDIGNAVRHRVDADLLGTLAE
ncbi:hypothetical protein F4561_001072 [Lipingzhangella halophila]|uniref:Uncharacterized protein n=1 Tax=Lipingzhangella halophila TaxID=1783352 RepID=A0A7W7W0T5_9ACTN|nr:hypothetical protein [Lipingzhangella halophila]